MVHDARLRRVYSCNHRVAQTALDERTDEITAANGSKVAFHLLELLLTCPWGEVFV
jgi:hypothetical protein